MERRRRPLFCKRSAVQCANAYCTLGSLAGKALKDESARAMALCSRVVARCFDSEGYVEGRRAFMEKHRPNFSGR
jgi:enoyl-CoA hydratase